MLDKKNNFRPRYLLSQKGITLVELVIFSGISVLVLLMSVALLTSSKKVNQEMTSFVELIDVLNDIQNNLRSDNAFEKTLTDPQNAAVFSCYNNNQDCAGAGGEFALFSEDGKLYEFAGNPAQPSKGLSSLGGVCNDFNSAGGSNSCPFRYRLSWSPSCPATGSCLNPLIQVSVKLDYKPKDNPIQINENAYTFSIYKTSFRAKLVENCAAVGGVYTPALRNCVMPFQGPCPPHQYIIGFDANGQKKCRYLKGFKCKHGQVLLGVDATGNAVCGPGCKSPDTTTAPIW